MRQNSMAGECRSFIDSYIIRVGRLIVAPIPGISVLTEGKER
jgi:hypothetical protein